MSGYANITKKQITAGPMDARMKNVCLFFNVISPSVHRRAGDAKVFSQASGLVPATGRRARVLLPVDCETYWSWDCTPETKPAPSTEPASSSANIPLTTAFTSELLLYMPHQGMTSVDCACSSPALLRFSGSSRPSTTGIDCALSTISCCVWTEVNSSSSARASSGCSQPLVMPKNWQRWSRWCRDTRRCREPGRT